MLLVYSLPHWYSWLCIERHHTPNALPVKSLAVLRFRDVDPQPDHALLGDAIATALATNLSRAPGLTLVSTDLSFQHSISRETAPQIGAALDARYVLDGTVRTDGSQIHATAVLYDARDGQQIYAYTQDEPLDQIFKLQDKTIADVLSELQIALNDEKSADMRDWGTKNVQAYLTVVDGHAARMRSDPRSIRLAIDRLRDAIRIDPGFVNAHVELAAALNGFAGQSTDPTVTESARREIANLRKVVMQIDPTSSTLPELTMLDATLGDSPQEIESAARTEIERIGVPSPKNSIEHLCVVFGCVEAGSSFSRGCRISGFVPRNGPNVAVAVKPEADARRNDRGFPTGDPGLQDGARIISKRQPSARGTGAEPWARR